MKRSDHAANTTATLKEVAALAGVSASTASRALSGNPMITPATREKVQRAAAELRYVPNQQARNLRRATSTVIGLSIPNMVNPFFTEMADAIQQAAEREGYSLLLVNTRENDGSLAAALRVFSGQRLAGAIVVPSTNSAAPLRQLSDTGLPVVQVDRRVADVEIPAVLSDPQPGLRAAVEHLAEQGHTVVGYLSGPQVTSTGQERLAAFERAAEAGELRPEVYYGSYERSEGYAGTNELLDRGVTALIAGDSMMTMGALEACHQRGTVIGTDLALIGFDDQPAFRIQPAPLSVIDQDVRAIGTRAWAMLSRMIHGEATTPTTIDRLPTRLIVRDSSARMSPSGYNARTDLKGAR